MSSIFRGKQNVPTKDSPISTKFVNLTTLSYIDTVVGDGSGYPLPIPFTYDNGVIDIRVQNGVYDNLLNTLSPQVLPLSVSQVRPMGGTGLIRRLGPNMLTLLGNILGPANFEISQPGIMTKVQQPTNYTTTDLSGADLFENNYLGQFSAVGVTTVKPPSDDFNLTGSADDEFGTFWVFQTPLTVKYTFSDVEYYMTFTTTFTKNIPIL